MKIHFGATVLILATTFIARASASDREGLQLELTPYVWMAGIDGKISAKGQTVDFNLSFSDLLQHVDAGFLGLGVLSYNRFVLYTDYNYLGITDNAKLDRGLVVPVGTKLNVDVNATIATLTGGYRFDTFGPNTIDVLFGTRTLSIDESIKFPNIKVNNNVSITDTIVMLRPSFQISDKWRFNPTLSYGIAGDSDETYELEPQFQFDFSKSFAMRVGYKKLFYKEEEGTKNTSSYSQMDGSFSGFFLGIGWTFPGRK